MIGEYLAFEVKVSRWVSLYKLGVSFSAARAILLFNIGKYEV